MKLSPSIHKSDDKPIHFSLERLHVSGGLELAESLVDTSQSKPSGLSAK